MIQVTHGTIMTQVTHGRPGGTTATKPDDSDDSGLRTVSDIRVLQVANVNMLLIAYFLQSMHAVLSSYTGVSSARRNIVKQIVQKKDLKCHL